MKVAVQPDSLAALRDRAGNALLDIHDMESIRLGVASPPSSLPQHVFDTEHGFRLCVSRERVPCGCIVTHLSSSLRVGSPFHRKMTAISDGARVWAAFKAESLRVYRAIFADKRTPTLVCTTEELIPHWWIAGEKYCTLGVISSAACLTGG